MVLAITQTFEIVNQPHFNRLFVKIIIYRAIQIQIILLTERPRLQNSSLACNTNVEARENIEM